MRGAAVILCFLVLASGCGQPQNETFSKQTSETPVKLAGNDAGAKYYEYDPQLYQAALAEGKTVYLEFYAKWCPICREMEPEIFAAFESLNNPSIVGFRVDYDTETELKREFQIPYQHTRIILKDGQVKARASDSWDRNKVKQELERIANG